MRSSRWGCAASGECSSSATHVGVRLVAATHRVAPARQPPALNRLFQRARSLAAFAPSSRKRDNAPHEHCTHERSRGHAGRQSQHAAQLGAALRLSEAAPHAGRPPPVRAGRGRVAAQAFSETHNISSAISLACERGEGPSTDARLRRASPPSTRTRPGACWRRAWPSARSSARSRGSCCPPSSRWCDEDPPAPEHQFAWRYATGWLAAAMRVAPPAHRSDGVLIFEAT